MIPLQLPARIGDYDVVAPIAAGGMGVVVLAERMVRGGFRRRVAIKLILPHLLGDADAHQLFHDEARLAARFTHPNLVPAIDFGEDAGCFFMVLEYVEGISVRAMLQRVHMLAPTVVAHIAVGTSNGLAWAHALGDDDGRPLGVVHRDITPDNFLLTTTGVVRVLDFGIARSRLGAHVTQAGVIRGKPQYLSPEQLCGTPVDDRADVWSLGVVLFELLAGAPPFAGEGMALMRAIIEEPLPRLPAMTPKPLAALIHHMMNRDGSTRPPMAEVAARARQWLEQQPELERTAGLAPWLGNDSTPPAPSGRSDDEATAVIRSQPSSPRPRRPWLAGVGVVAAMAATIIGFTAADEPVEPLTIVEPLPIDTTTPSPLPTIPSAPIVDLPAAVDVPPPIRTKPRAKNPTLPTESIVVAATTDVLVGEDMAGFYVVNRRPYVDVYVDGHKLGVSPLGSKRKPIPLSLGTHDIVLTDPATGISVATRRIEFRAGHVEAIR
jgi:eukaryotic-like serine/threonine-protein kinase